jgi:cyclopropane fatty-acyl-phospholipid synthase-like methyltransferase
MEPFITEGVAMDTKPVSPGRELSGILLGNRVQQAVYVAAKLGIADLLCDRPRSVEDLARDAGAHPEALRRLLRALASFGVFAEDDAGRYSLTPIADLLRSGTRESKRAFALWSGGVSYRLFGALEYSVLTGKPAFDNLFGMEFFEYLEQNPDVGNLFDEFMSRQTAPMGSVLARYDLSGVETIVDVGGGRGELVAAVLGAHPKMRGVLIDREHAIEGAAKVLHTAGVADRCTTVCGDYMESVPPAGDAYLLKNVVHGLDDEAATRLLANCRTAMNNSGRVLLVEFVILPGNDPSPGKVMDLLMLVGSRGGRERTEQEFRTLLTASGFRVADITTTRYAYSVIDARPDRASG